MRKGRALPIAPAALQLRKGHVQKHWYMYLHKHIYTNIWKYKCACTSPGVHKAFLWKGAAEIHPLNLWALLQKPSEAEAKGAAEIHPLNLWALLEKPSEAEAEGGERGASFVK